MSDKPVIYFNDAVSTTASGEYCIKLLRRNNTEQDDKDKKDEGEIVGELYMTFSTAVRLWKVLEDDVQTSIKDLAVTLSLDEAQLRRRFEQGKDVRLDFLDPLRNLLND